MSGRRPDRHRARIKLACLAAQLALLLSACAGASSGTAASGSGSGSGTTVLVYTSFSQPEVDALVGAYRTAHPEAKVEVFRAPTGQLNARVAAEKRGGTVRGDVLLLSDPLSMQQYAAQGMLRRWSPADASFVPPEAHSDTFWGVAFLDVVVVSQPGLTPLSWQDLTGPRYRDAVALPDPGFAGSAFGALGFFAQAPGYGVDYYKRLKSNGAVQVQSPTDVITGVAEKRFKAGMTLDFLARAAIAKGSPLQMSAPEPGAVRLYAPVAVFGDTSRPAAAEAFAGFLLTEPAQQALAEQRREPIRPDVPAKTPALKEVAPDWPLIFQRRGELLADYRAVFGG